MTHDVSLISTRRYVEVDGQRIRVFVHDDRTRVDGPVVVLIHGAGGNYLHWPPQLRRIPGVLVIAPDLPGHGGSEGAGYDRVDAYAKALAELADSLDLGRFVVIGHSMGAAIALEVGCLAGDRVAAIGALAGGVELPIADELMELLRTDFSAATDWITDAALGTDRTQKTREVYLRRLRETNPEVLYKDFAACRTFDARPYAALLNMPAAVIAGSLDRLVPTSASLALHELMPCSELHVLAGAAHMYLWERTEEVLQLILGLVERIDW